MASLLKRAFGAGFLFLCLAVWPVADAWAGSEPIASDTSDSDIICLLDSSGSGSGTGSQTIAGPVNCPTNASGEVTPRQNAAAGMGGLRSNAGHRADAPADKWNICRYVDNVSANDYFVPFRSQKEWIDYLNNKPSDMSVQSCARPYDSDANDSADQSRGLVYGPTSALPAQGDTMADGSPAVLYQSAAFPYWRTDEQWGAPDASISYKCREDYAESYCPGGYTCDGDCHTDSLGNTTCNRHNDCCRSGTQCKSTYHTWTEIWALTGTALNSDTETPSWKGASSRLPTSETRPCACLHRYHQSGESCIHDPQPGEDECIDTTPHECAVPPPHNWTPYTLAVSNVNYQTSTTFQQWNAIVAAFDLTVEKSTDSCTKQKQMGLRNDFIDAGNAAALAW